MLKDVSGGRDQKRLFLFLTLLAVSETWLSLTLLAALIGVPQRQLGSILQKIEGTIIFLDDDHYHFSHSLTREYLLDTQQPYCLEENDKVKAHQPLYRMAHFSYPILTALLDLLIEAVEIQGKSAIQGMESDSKAIPEVIPYSCKGSSAGGFPTGGCFAPVAEQVRSFHKAQ